MMLQVAERDQIVYLQVHAPVPLGEPSDRLAWQLIDASVQIEERVEPPAGVVLAAAGDAFWLMPPESADDCDRVGSVWAEALHALARLGPPTVAAISADAIGPAWELALACDLRVAATDVRVGSPEIQWGRIPAAGGTQRLARIAGQATALRLLLLGELLAAPAAHDLGLVHRVAPASDLDACLEELVGSLRASAPVALAYVKETVQQGTALPFTDGLRLEADLAALLQTTQDRAEGLRAFLERRSARFVGR